jgi:hypothetical protein
MNLRLELQIKPWKQTLRLKDKVMLLGSCFTEHMATKLRAHRFRVLENPHGILFNPLSILHALKCYADQTVYKEKDIFFHNDIWQSWHHHGRFASVNQQEALTFMNTEAKEGALFLRSADWIIITLGSAFVYELNPGTSFADNREAMAVANCHKVPQPNFVHRMMHYEEVINSLKEMLDTISSINPRAKVIFTISPVRHHREGLVENNRSKGLLHLGVHHHLQRENVFYFPAYELVIDDLRDYRFFAEDLAHPNYLATQYVWEKFLAACIDEESRLLMERINRLNAAMQHRPRLPQSEKHKSFLAGMLADTKDLEKMAPYLDLSAYLQYFSGN